MKREAVRSGATDEADRLGRGFQHLPEEDIIKDAGGPAGIYADKMPVDTGGAMIERTPGDPAWRKGGLWQSDTMPIKVRDSGS